MKNIFAFIALGILLFTIPLSSQVKIAHFNSEAIIKELPDAIDAQAQLDKMVAEWQQELNKMEGEWKSKYEEYDKRKLIMTDQRRAQAENELQEMDKKIVDYRNKYFGQNGELFKKQNELMKPVQDRIFKAVQDVAVEEGYDYVLDKSGDILLMYANEKYDLTQKIFEKLKVSIAGEKK
ncbi:MAG: OmpH family outer membrane protein [Bacteroidetes bacterium]|nr:OmpH family outer membrane protein [Bacteroidota bacterium]